MARNSDGTVVLKTAGKLSRTYVSGGTKMTVTHAYKGGSGGGNLNSYRRGWRAVGKTER